MIGVLILETGARNHSKVPSSEVRGDRSFDFRFTGGPHQSEAPSSEISGGRGSDFKIRRAPSHSQVPSSEFRGGRSSDFKIRGPPSVRGSILGSSVVVRVLILRIRGAP